MSINVKTAVNSAQTYQELLSISRQLDAKLSSYGYRYAVITDQSSLYQGAIAMGAVAEKAMEIRRRMEENRIPFISEEEESVTLLCTEISRLYSEDAANCAQADRLTTVLIFIMNIIFWINHQSKWSNSRNSFSYKEQLQQPLSTRVRTTVQLPSMHAAPSYREYHAHLGFLQGAHLPYWRGYQYSYAVPEMQCRNLSRPAYERPFRGGFLELSRKPLETKHQGNYICPTPRWNDLTH